MKKSLMNISLMGLVAINLSGCFSENVSCSSKTVKELVEEITLPETKENMIAELLNEKTSMSGTLYLSMKKLAALAGTESKLQTMQGLESLPEIKVQVDNEYKNMKFSLGDIRTLAKDKDLNSVECAGKITIKTANYELDYDIEYNAQLGDDKEKIFVEVSSLE